MDLDQFTNSLSPDRQLILAIKFARLALPIWDDYVSKNELTYIDTVVGMRHTVNKQLLKETIDEVQRFVSANGMIIISSSDDQRETLSLQFDDPRISLQDQDWELPEAVKLTFYSVYNLLETSLGKTKTTFGEATIYVSINQAIDALLTSGTLTLLKVNEIIEVEKNVR